MLRTHQCGDLTAENENQSVELCGWVASRRDHGGIIFVDLRDSSGITQVTFDPETSAPAHQNAEKIRPEWVLRIFGKVKKRQKGLENPNLKTGEIEVFVEKVEILNPSKTPPFEISAPKIENQSLRMEFRYLDLRREKMQQNLRLRAQICAAVREFFTTQNFLEIETPALVKGTPEGASEYLVPSRVHPGKFFVLPQSPQQFKQLLILGGVDRYFQIARCFRDEDLRGDRQPEFTQLDLEMAFCEQEDVLQVVENSFHFVIEKVGRSADAQKFLNNGRFVRMTWQEAAEKYGSDKPDLRFELAFENISDLATDSGFGIFASASHLFALRVPQETGEFSRKIIDDLTQIAQQNGAGGLAWLRVGEDSGPVAKNATPEFLSSLVARTSAKEGDIIFFGAAASLLAATSPLGAVRSEIGNLFSLADPNDLCFLIVTDFPLLEIDDNGRRNWAHHPFTMPHPEDISKLDNETQMMDARAWCYDFILNGVELGSGSIRIHDPALQRKVFEVLGLSAAEIDEKFGHILRAFQYGCPPHGGYAFGIDRLVMLFAAQPNIREVIAFPKNQSAQDLLMGAPSPLPESVLVEQNIAVLEKEQDDR